MIRPKRALRTGVRAIKLASSLVKMVGQAKKEETSAQPQKRMVRTAMQAMNVDIIKMLVRITVLLVKGLAALLGVSSSAIILLCVIMMIAALLTSPFAIFMADDNTELGTQQISRIADELDEQFLALLERERQAAGKVERVEMHYTGSAANSLIDNWPGGLAVFAVKTSMSVARLDVATMDRQRVEMLRAVYWDMNQIASNVETLEHTRMVAVEARGWKLRGAGALYRGQRADTGF